MPTTITTGITNTGHAVTDIIFDPAGDSWPFLSNLPLGYVGCEQVDLGVLGGIGFYSTTTPLVDEGTYLEAVGLGNITLTITPVASTPEPSTIALLATGILSRVGLVRRRATPRS